MGDNLNYRTVRLKINLIAIYLLSTCLFFLLIRAFHILSKYFQPTRSFRSSPHFGRGYAVPLCRPREAF